MQIETELVLNKFFLALFGKRNFNELHYMNHLPEGFDEDGAISYYSEVQKILSQRTEPIAPEIVEIVKFIEGKLENYEQNIRQNLQIINAHRTPSIYLKYFQYWAVLFSEIYFDLYFSGPDTLIIALNSFAERIGKQNILFSHQDLRKIAFWMATGSGKTLITHLNYLQFCQYNKGPYEIPFDNILLITPNENMTRQHYLELQQSGLPAQIYQRSARGEFSKSKNPLTITILDIYKLTENKVGDGISIDVEEFGNSNIIFVDEGHKGAGGEKWFDLRAFLAFKGFAIEYSATFGQALAAVKSSDQENLKVEYSKAILFNYSYKYFYHDGYGKEYEILNLQSNLFQERHHLTILIANLLTFYEKLLLFEEHGVEFLEYSIEKPLWLFVGSKVKGDLIRSDVKNILIFLNTVLLNEQQIVTSKIQQIMEGNSELLDENGNDLYQDSPSRHPLIYLKERYALNKSIKTSKKNQNANTGYKEVANLIYNDLLSKLFYTPKSSRLHLYQFTRAKGEIGLATEGTPIFGVVNIGEEQRFLHSVKELFPIHQDIFTKSLFTEINLPQSRVNILIGAKKFIEGWNSWRVVSIGLLYIGKNEGTQIIQLFGRGVRLHGKNNSLKRSRFITNEPPNYLEILETLNIFGIHADYMANFRAYLSAEGLIEAPHHESSKMINQELSISSESVSSVQNSRFAASQVIALEKDLPSEILIELDLMPKIAIISSQTSKKQINSIHSKEFHVIPDAIVASIDWQKVYLDLLAYRQMRSWYNFIFTQADLKKIILAKKYRIICTEDQLTLHNFQDLLQWQDIIIRILKKYLGQYYTLRKNVWEQSQ